MRGWFCFVYVVEKKVVDVGYIHFMTVDKL